MNWDQVEGKWKQRRGQAVRQWGKTMNDELAAAAGKHEELVGKLQERYGIVKQQVDELKRTIRELRKRHPRLMELQKPLQKRKRRRPHRDKDHDHAG